MLLSSSSDDPDGDHGMAGEAAGASTAESPTADLAGEGSLAGSAGAGLFPRTVRSCLNNAPMMAAEGSRMMSPDCGSATRRGRGT